MSEDLFIEYAGTKFILRNPVLSLGCIGIYLAHNFTKTYQEKREEKNMIRMPELPNISGKAKDIWSFFRGGNNEKISKERLMEKAFNEYAELVAKTSSEIEDILLAILHKQQEGNMPDKLTFIYELNVELTNYPVLPNDVTEVAEIEGAIQARKEHHAKIKLTVENYLSSSSPANDSIETDDKTYNI